MTPPLPGIEHIILLMFENRSFDNMLGGLYPATINPDGGGVPVNWSNPWTGHKDVPAWQAPAGSAAQIIPNPDPNELFVDMQQQLFDPAPMMGFVNNYATVPNVNPPDIMQYYRKENIPVTYAMAKTYAVSDRYFGSGPVQTWPNRLFSLCGTPGYDPKTNLAYLNNTDYPDNEIIAGQLDFPSIFEQLDSVGKSWKVYHEDEFPISAIINYVWKHWDWVESGGNVWPYKEDVLFEGGTFFDDVKKNKLPAFSLIEPRYQMLSADGYKAPTSNHPGDSSVSGTSGAPISIANGEAMLGQVYKALVANPSLFAKTLLVVTYDEHGGLFDHVPPPAAVSPFTVSVNNFNYSYYGARVPALFINPHVVRGVFRPSSPSAGFDHTSLLATLKAQFGFTSSLSPRVDAAETFAGLIDPSGTPIPNVDIDASPDSHAVDNATKGHAAPVLQSALLRSRMKNRKG